LVLLNPAVFFLSGAWGQIDSILTLFLVLSFRQLLRNDRIGAGALFGLAIAFKWQALIYGPVLAAGYLLTMRRNRDLVHTALGVVAALAVLFLVGLPFQGDQGALWMLQRFVNAAGGYDYASVEAYNFLSLAGGNWAPADRKFLLGINYKQFGTVAIVLVVCASLWMQYRCARLSLHYRRPAMENQGILYLAAGLCMFGIFTFGHYMHERYVFPVIVLLLFAFVYYREPRLLLCAMALSVVLFLNEMSAMYVVSEMAMSVVRSGREHQDTVLLCSFMEVLTFVYFLWVVLTMDIHGEEVAE
jgi:Gpi18-like mannosyltransferase